MTRKRQASTAAPNHRAASIRRIEASATGRPARWANCRMPRATDVLHRIAIVGASAASSRASLSQTASATSKFDEPVRASRPLRPLTFDLGGTCGARQGPQLGAGDPRRITDDQQGAALAPAQVTPQVEPEEVRAGDRDMRSAIVRPRQEFFSRPAMRRLDLDAPDFPRRRRVGQQARQEVPPAAGGFQHPRPARADRSQGLQHRVHQPGRGLEVTEVPAHAISPPAPCRRIDRRRIT